MRNYLKLIFMLRGNWRCLAVLLAIPVLFAFTGNSLAQEKVQITGTVTDAITAEALPGVSILIKGTTTGTITDIDGNYSIKALPTDVLVFSFLALAYELRTYTPP